MNNILDLSSSLDFNNSNVIKGEIEIDDVFELENNIEILVQDKIIEPTREIQTVTADEDYDQLGTVTVNPIPDEYIIPDGTLDVDANGDVDVTMFRMARVGVYIPPTLQDKEVTPTKEEQIISYDEDYDGLNSVIVNSIPDEYIIPSGTLDINKNGTQNISNYDNVKVKVESVANIGPKHLYLIKDGVEQTDITGGSAFLDMGLGTGYTSISQGSGYLGLCVAEATRSFTFVNSFDYNKYTKLYIEWAYPKADNYGNYVAPTIGVKISKQPSDASVVKTFLMNGGDIRETKPKTITELDIMDATEGSKVNVIIGRTGYGSDFPNYPAHIYNLYLESSAINLQDKSIEITENGITNIVADEGYDGLGNIAVITDVQNDASTISAMYLIENGIENRDITQGYTFEDFVAQVANANAVKQMDASFNMYSGLWARGNVTFNADFDFTQCKKMYIEYEFPATDLISSMHQYMDVTVRLLDQAGETLTAVQIVGGRTVNRTTVEIPLDDINQVGKVFFSSSNLSGTNRDGNSPYSEAYPVRFFNVWFDVIDTAPVLQDKIIDVTENGTIIVTPDSDYDGLSSVTINTNAIEDLTEELTNYDSGLTTQKTSIQDIISVLDKKIGNGKYAPRHMSFYCYPGTEAELIEDLAKLDTSNLTSTRGMFNACFNITKLSLNNFNTSNVTNMRTMFYYCKDLIELDLSSFNTSNVTNMNGMFKSSKSLTKIDMRNFDFAKVTDYTDMFKEVPINCLIIVKDDAAKTWITSKFTTLTNVKTVAELEEEYE